MNCALLFGWRWGVHFFFIFYPLVLKGTRIHVKKAKDLFATLTISCSVHCNQVKSMITIDIVLHFTAYSPVKRNSLLYIDL